MQAVEQAKASSEGTTEAAKNATAGMNKWKQASYMHSSTITAILFNRVRILDFMIVHVYKITKLNSDEESFL